MNESDHSSSVSSMPAASTTTNTTSQQWKPISSVERRILGVLVEKAKTVPDSYPLTLVSLTSGANQKTNRFPLMNLEPEDVEEALDHLRQLGAVTLVQGFGRVEKYRHCLHDWMGVEKVELAVMAELLLRGAQSEGDLRSRASRMEPIPDLPTLRTLLKSLMDKGLVLAVTPEGRGQIFAHALYQPQELEKVYREAGRDGASVAMETSAKVAAQPSGEGSGEASAAHHSQIGDATLVTELQAAINSTRQQMQLLQNEVQRLTETVQTLETDLQRLRSELGA